MHPPRSAAPRQLRLFAEPSVGPAVEPTTDHREGHRAAPRPVPAATGTPDDGGETLRRRLQPLLDRRLASLVLTDNLSRILSAHPAPGGSGGGVALRIHRCFTAADDPTLAAVAEFCTTALAPRGVAMAARRRRALAAIRTHFEASGPPREARRRRRTPLRPVGRCFDLEALCERLNRRWFGGELTAGITWGRGRAGGGGAGCRRRRGGRVTLQLGSYTAEDDLIRIHPALDRPWVPAYVVEAVIHHELLHAALPAERVNGRRRLHPPEFRRRERAYPDHARAERWIAAHLGRLVAARG